jgi:hypothetical protein
MDAPVDRCRIVGLEKDGESQDELRESRKSVAIGADVARSSWVNRDGVVRGRLNIAAALTLDANAIVKIR